MDKVISKDGTVIAYEKTGTGPALILVGGGLCDRKTAASGMPMAQHLASHFTVCSYDRRGRGDSGDTLPYAVEREIEDISALITQAGGSAYIYGMSSGGILSIKAVLAGLPITKLVVYEPPFSIDTKHASEWIAYTAQLKVLIENNDRANAIKLFMTTAGMPKILISLLRYTPIWGKILPLAPTLVYDAAIVGDRMLPYTELAKITIPAIVIDGGNSPANMLDSARALAGALPNGQHRTLEGQTHNVNAKVLATALTELLQ
ncbi:MAG TPA: alpha/beta hydrolase [Candidatus Saccharimonadales bacterium]|nr:alpha/beta hydrolase [Candidatus Saccharimonadales bacterium]